MPTWKEKAQPLIAHRAQLAQQRLHDVIVGGEKIWRYTYGDPPLWHNQEEWESYLQRYSTESEDQKIKQGWLTTIVPLHAVLRGVVLPFIMGGKAKWFNERRIGAGSLEAGRNELYARLANAVWEQSDAKAVLYRALDDAFWARVGWVETDLDDRTMFPRHRWRDCRDILVDVETRDPDHSAMRWTAVKEYMPIETAEWMAKELWDAKGYEFTPIPFIPDEDYRPREQYEVVPGARKRDLYPISSNETTDFVRVLRVYVKGENPHTTSAKLNKKAMDDPAGHDNMYDGKDHVLIVEAPGGYGLADSYQIIGRIDWPYPCDPGETPLTPVKLTRDNRSFYPYPITQPAHPLQVITNVALSSYYTDMRNSARRIGGLQPEAFQNEADAEQLAESDEALLFAMLKKGHNIDSAFQIKNFGAPNSSLNTGQEIGRDLYRLISGLQSFEVEVRANQTAFNTSIQNTQSKLKLEDIAGQPEKAALSMQRKAIMCARWNLNYEEIKRYVIPPKGQDDEGNDFERIQRTGRGVEQEVSLLWDISKSPQDIRDEVAVKLEARSMRFKNPDQEAAEIKELSDYQTQMVRIAGDTLGKGNSSGARAILKLMNKTVTAIAKLKNIMNYEDLLIDPDEVGPADTPPVDPNTMIDAETQREVSAQQQAAATRLKQQGVDATDIPAEVGGAG